MGQQSNNAQDYRGFGLYPLPGILRNAKIYSISETSSVSILR
jgi:hypothetical protein